MAGDAFISISLTKSVPASRMCSLQVMLLFLLAVHSLAVAIPHAGVSPAKSQAPLDGKHAVLMRVGKTAATIGTDAHIHASGAEPSTGSSEMEAKTTVLAEETSAFDYSKDYRYSAAVVNGLATSLADKMDLCNQDNSSKDEESVLCPHAKRDVPSSMDWGLSTSVDVGDGDFTVWLRYKLRWLQGTEAALAFSSGHLIGLDANCTPNKYFLGGGSWGESRLQGVAHPAGVWRSLLAIRSKGELRITVDGSMPFINIAMPENVSSLQLRPWRNQMSVRDFMLAPGVWQEPWRIQNGAAAAAEAAAATAIRAFGRPCAQPGGFKAVLLLVVGMVISVRLGQ